MKKFICLLCLALAFYVSVEANPLKRFNFSVWTDYSGMEFEGLSQEEKTAKLQRLFSDKAAFIQTYDARRVLIRIPNPALFDFFKPENYDASRDDNFYYWALKLSQHAELEAVFDAEAFDLGTQSWTDRILGFAGDFFRIEKPLGDFLNLPEKLAWVSFINEMVDSNAKKQYLVRGITIDPKHIDEGLLQEVINILDQYKYNALEDLPSNPFPSVRLAVCIGVDQKAMAFCNLSHFPLHTDIRGQKPRDLGLTPPENFPSSGPQYLAPEWRSHVSHPILDTVYLKMADKRLIESIYQNHAILENPAEPNPEGALELSRYLGRNFRGAPFIKGPGHITHAKGTKEVDGMYTFFRTGGGLCQQGQFIGGGSIEIRPPFVSKAVRKVIADDPESNKEIQLTSTFSTTQDIEKAEYFLTATPVQWTTPRISNSIRSKIYFVFSTDFEPHEGRFFGNWHLENFLDFLHSPKKKVGKKMQPETGFLSQVIFKNLNGRLDPPVNNVVLYDFTTIPNGTPYPECDWQLGNQNHH